MGRALILSCTTCPYFLTPFSLAGPPHKQRYLRYEGEAASSSNADSAGTGALLEQVEA